LSWQAPSEPAAAAIRSIRDRGDADFDTWGSRQSAHMGQAELRHSGGRPPTLHLPDVPPHRHDAGKRSAAARASDADGVQACL